MKLVSTILLGLMLSTAAFAEGPLPPHNYLRNVYGYSWCQISYRYESYAAGAYKAFTGRGQKPTLMDTVCWNLGIKHGKKIKEEYDFSAFCDGALQEGLEDGLAGDNIHLDTPTDCYYIGRNYGLSYLSMNAREGNVEKVGAECVKAYKRGNSDSRNHRVSTPPSNYKLNYCYDTGYFDGGMFRD